MMYEIKGQDRSYATAGVVLAAVKDALSQNHSRIESEDDSSFVFTSTAFQLNWHIFGLVSRGVVSVQAEEGHSVVSYKISLLGFRYAAALYSIVGIVMAIVMAVSFGDISCFWIPVLMLLFFFWCFGYGVNYLAAIVLASCFFNRVVSNIPAEAPPIPKKQIETVQQGAPADAERPRR